MPVDRQQKCIWDTRYVHLNWWLGTSKVYQGQILHQLFATLTSAYGRSRRQLQPDAFTSWVTLIRRKKYQLLGSSLGSYHFWLQWVLASPSNKYILSQQHQKLRPREMSKRVLAKGMDVLVQEHIASLTRCRVVEKQDSPFLIGKRHTSRAHLSHSHLTISQINTMQRQGPNPGQQLL